MKEDNKNTQQYDDIINLQHHVSSNRVHMSILDRAAQFSPFAALTGFDGAIKETARLTDQRILLEEAAKTILDEKLRIVQEQLSRQKEIEIVFFRPEERIYKFLPKKFKKILWCQVRNISTIGCLFSFLIR